MMSKTKTKMRRKNDGSSDSDSFALFSDDIVVPVVSGDDNSSHRDVTKEQEVQETERSGSCAVDEKSEHIEPSHKETHHSPKRGFRAVTNAEVNCRPEDSAVCAGRHGNKESSSGNRENGNTEKGCLESAGGQDKRTGRPKSKVQKAKRRAGVREDDKAAGENIEQDVDYDKYPLAEFERSSKVVSRKISGKPRNTDDPFVVEIVIDGLRYRVSKCSIKGDTYIQGLDSRFIISKLVTKK